MSSFPWLNFIYICLTWVWPDPEPGPQIYPVLATNAPLCQSVQDLFAQAATEQSCAQQ